MAAYLDYTFVKMGIQTTHLDGAAGTMLEKAHLIHQDEVLVAISFHPYTANTKELVGICLDNNVPVIALTDSTLSPISRADDLHLEVLEEEISGIRGLSATMCLALSLAVETGRCRSAHKSDQSRP